MTAHPLRFDDIVQAAMEHYPNAWPGCQLQVSTTALAAIRRRFAPRDDTYNPRPYMSAGFEVLAGVPVIVCEDWAPGTWALVDRDGAVIESGSVRLMAASYLTPVSRALWAQKETLRWPKCVTPLRAQLDSMNPAAVLVTVEDTDAPEELQGRIVELFLRRVGDEVVVADRRPA